MMREIEVGTILMEDRPAITKALGLEGESFSGGWGMLKTRGGACSRLTESLRSS